MIISIGSKTVWIYIHTQGWDFSIVGWTCIYRHITGDNAYNHVYPNVFVLLDVTFDCAGVGVFRLLLGGIEVCEIQQLTVELSLLWETIHTLILFWR